MLRDLAKEIVQEILQSARVVVSDEKWERMVDYVEGVLAAQHGVEPNLLKSECSCFGWDTDPFCVVHSR